MIEDARRIANDTNLRCQLCIVGAGAAGVTLAMELANSKIQVILLEAGGISRAGKSLELYKGEVSDPMRHRALNLDRYRQLGGTTALWGGRCVPYDEIDFQERDYVRFSGWPINREDLESCYRRAHEYCECGDYRYLLPQTAPELISNFSEGDWVTTTLERWSPPTHFGKRYRSELHSAKNVLAYVNAVCLKLFTSPDGERVSHLNIATFSGRRFRIFPDITVLAGGGLEVTRLLLASNAIHREGIGNHSDWLGRGYMCHVGGAIARAELRSGVRAIFGYERDSDGIYYRRRIAPSEDAQRRHRLLNIHMLFDRPLLDDPSHGSSTLSLAFLIKRLVAQSAVPAYGGSKYALYWKHLMNILAGSPQALATLPEWGRDRLLRRRRIPSLLQPPTDNIYHIHFHSEQSPNPASRATLSAKQDRFGVPRLMVDFRVSEQDIDSICRAHQLLGSQLRRQECGRLLFNSDDLPSLVQGQRATLGHHIGTTRMAERRADGVVDRNCRVFGLKNLFIASSSVFPTSSQANPTLTIIAMAIRLADHLKKLV